MSGQQHQWIDQSGLEFSEGPQGGSPRDVKRRTQSPRIILPEQATDDLASAIDHVRLETEESHEHPATAPAVHQPLQYHHQKMLSDSSIPASHNRSSRSDAPRG
jgi:hypothetical protein